MRDGGERDGGERHEAVKSEGGENPTYLYTPISMGLVVLIPATSFPRSGSACGSGFLIRGI